MQHPLRLAVFISVLAYVGGIVALLWRRPNTV